MASVVSRTALRATRPLRAAERVTSREKDELLRKAAKRDPELYILGAVMVGAFGLAGYYFARKPTSSSSETNVTMKPDSEPWKTGGKGKYQYYPGGDRSVPVKDAPSALHSVVIPNVNLPKELHDRFNKYDKEEFDDY